MDFPPINLNVSSLAIQQLHISDIIVDKTSLGVGFTNLYYLFVTLFVLVMFQTIAIYWFAIKYRRQYQTSKQLPLLNNNLGVSDT
jgi:hypothetical protein